MQDVEDSPVFPADEKLEVTDEGSICSYDARASNGSLASEVDIVIMDDDRTAQPSRAPRKKKKNVPNPSRDQLRTRARAKKTHEPDPFLSVGNVHSAPEMRFATSAKSRSTVSTELRGPLNTPHRSVATSMSGVTWNPLVPRRPRKALMEAVKHNPTNHHVSAPFKQINAPSKENKHQVLPEQAMKEKTAIATYLVSRAMAKQMPYDEPKYQGKLQKGRLKPLNPVQIQGPTIDKCRGVVSQARTYSSSPSRTLQRRRYLLSTLSKEFFERPQTVESIHRTSIASDISENREQEIKELEELAAAPVKKDQALNSENVKKETQVSTNRSTDATQEKDGNDRSSCVAREESSNDTKAVRFEEEGEEEEHPNEKNDKQEMSEEQRLVQEFVGDQGQTYDGSCDKSDNEQEGTLDAGDADSANCNNNNNEDDGKKKKKKQKKSPSNPLLAKKPPLSARFPTINDPAESFWELDVGNQRQPVYNPRPRSRLGLWEDPCKPDSNVSDLSVTGSHSFDFEPLTPGRLFNRVDRTPRESFEMEGPYLKSSALRVYGKKERPKSAGPLQYLIEAKKKQEMQRRRPISATPWRNLKLNTTDCVHMQQLHLNTRCTPSPRKPLSAQYRPATTRPLSAKAAKLHPTPRRGKKASKEAVAKCTYCGASTDEVNFETGNYFSVCQSCLRQTRRPLEDDIQLEVVGSNFDADERQSVTSEQLSEVAGLVVSEALRNVLREEDSASETPSEVLSEMAENLVLDVLNKVTTGLGQAPAARGQSELRMLAEKVFAAISKELSQRVHVAEMQFPEELCVQLGNLARQVVSVMGCESSGDSRVTEDQLAGVAKVAVSAVIENLDEILAAMNAAESQEDQGDQADVDAWDKAENGEVLKRSADEMIEVEVEKVAESFVAGVIENAAQDCLSSKATNGNHCMQDQLINNLNDLEESLEEVQKEIQECLQKSQSKEDLENEGEDCVDNAAKKTSTRRENCYNLTVYQYNEISADSDEPTMDASFVDGTTGEISQFDVVMKRESNVLDDPVSSMDSRLLDIICNNLTDSLRNEKKTGKKVSKRTLENTPLEVVASAKALYRSRSAKNPDNSHLSPHPPLCFKVNARPPRGYLYYFAYGMDMNPERFSNSIQRRVKERFWGLLYGFKLVFNKKGSDAEAGSFPNIEFDPSSSVEGCLYLISPDELEMLDACTGYPQHFEHVMMPVWLLNCSSPDDLGIAQYCVPALMYIAQNKWIDEGGNLDSSYSASQCMKGADLLSPAYKEHLAKFQ